CAPTVWRRVRLAAYPARADDRAAIRARSQRAQAPYAARGFRRSRVAERAVPSAPAAERPMPRRGIRATQPRRRPAPLARRPDWAAPALDRISAAAAAAAVAAARARSAPARSGE